MNYKGPGFYKHYKGDTYIVGGLAFEEATRTPVVVYRPATGRQVDTIEGDGEPLEVRWWTRPLENFNERVWHDGRVIGQGHLKEFRDESIPRFEFVGHSSA